VPSCKYVSSFSGLIFSLQMFHQQNHWTAWVTFIIVKLVSIWVYAERLSECDFLIVVLHLLIIISRVDTITATPEQYCAFPAIIWSVVKFVVWKSCWDGLLRFTLDVVHNAGFLSFFKGEIKDVISLIYGLKTFLKCLDCGKTVKTELLNIRIGFTPFTPNVCVF